jgi:arsenate reductase (thioredoxin)
MRLLVLCTHNSARSQMAEGWLRHYASVLGLDAEVHSAGTEKTRVKDDAVTAMKEVGIDLRGHSSKTLYDLPDPWNFDMVLTVCDSANESCPSYLCPIPEVCCAARAQVREAGFGYLCPIREAGFGYPAKTRRYHVSFPDPSGQELDAWRKVRDDLGRMSKNLAQNLRESHWPEEEALKRIL